MIKPGNITLSNTLCWWAQVLIFSSLLALAKHQMGHFVIMACQQEGHFIAIYAWDGSVNGSSLL